MDWIPVTVDVPTEGTFVLVSVDQMYVDIAFYRLGRFIVNMKQVQPNAWMMLPTPYYAGKHARR